MIVPPSPAELSELSSHVRVAIAVCSPAVVQELMQALVHEIRVEGRHSIRPVFRVPQGNEDKGAVRAPLHTVGAEGVEPSLWAF